MSETKFSDEIVFSVENDLRLEESLEMWINAMNSKKTKSRKHGVLNRSRNVAGE